MCLMAICSSSLNKVYSVILSIFQLGCLFLDIELHELFAHFQCYPFISHIIQNYFLPFCRLSFHLFLFIYLFFFAVKKLLSLIMYHLFIFLSFYFPEET